MTLVRPVSTSVVGLPLPTDSSVQIAFAPRLQKGILTAKPRPPASPTASLMCKARWPVPPCNRVTTPSSKVLRVQPGPGRPLLLPLGTEERPGGEVVTVVDRHQPKTGQMRARGALLQVLTAGD